MTLFAERYKKEFGLNRHWIDIPVGSPFGGDDNFSVKTGARWDLGVSLRLGPPRKAAPEEVMN